MKYELIIKCEIDVLWDEKESVYIATSEDIPGLVLEAGSLDSIQQRLQETVPDLLDINNPDVEIIPSDEGISETIEFSFNLM